MGMAASQARLLTLTARIHDVEYLAQSIQNAKVQLATKEDQVYEEYQNALNATSLTFTMMNGAETSTQIATFNNLFSINSATTGNFSNYVLIGKHGKVVVDNDIYVGYNEFKSLGLANETAYAFAMYMMTGGDVDSVDSGNSRNNWSITSGTQISENPGSVLSGNTSPSDFEEALISAEELVYENHSDDSILSDAYDSVLAVFEKYSVDAEEDIYNIGAFDELPDEEYDKAIEEYTNAMNRFTKCLYTRGNYAAEIYSELMGYDEDEFDLDDFNTNEFNYYVSIYKAIEKTGGCESIENYNGMIETGENVANNSDWLTNMVQSGQMSIEKINEDKKTGEITLMGTSPSSDTNLKYTTTSDIDKRALAKAEAKYEHDMKLIDKKEQMFDLDLSKLETERTALTTEYDSVKKVIQDNVDRTFGIFS